MSRYFLTLFFALTAAGGIVTTAAGCTEEEADPKTTSSSGLLTEAGIEAKEYFVDRVYPPLNTQCGTCHSGTGGGGSVFLAADADATYSRIEGSVGLIAEPGRSPLIQHLHTDKAVTLSPELRNLLTQWLNLEATARGLTGSIAVAPTLSEAYTKYADCMDFDLWNFYRVGDLSFAQTDLDGPCMGCHSTGQGGAYLAAGSRETFSQAKQFPFIQKYVVGQVDGQGRFEKLVPSNRFIDKGNEACPVGKVDCHPPFGLPPNIQTALTAFVNTTLQNLAGGTCHQNIPVLVKDAGGEGG